jgi:integrase
VKFDLSTLWIDNTITFWFDSADLSHNSRRQYLNAIRDYVNLIDKSPLELIEEAEAEIKAGKLMRERSIKRYLVEFRKHLQQERNLSPNTVRLYLAAVRSFYDSYDIDYPKKMTPKRSGYVVLEKNKRVAEREEIIDSLKLAGLRGRCFILTQCNSGISTVDMINLTVGVF